MRFLNHGGHPDDPGLFLQMADAGPVGAILQLGLFTSLSSYPLIYKT
jgi:hypothetical protein